MVNVTYIESTGQQRTLQLEEGTSVMAGAVDDMIPGIEGECGGVLTCCTCHCYVDPGWVDKLPKPEQIESDLMEYVDDANEYSRLSCQIKVTEEMDGLTVRIPG
jgi:2Fe-2S ferredoxin